MNPLLLLLALSTQAAPPEPVEVPVEMQAFIEDRNACDHFRGEPVEGDSDEQRQRRESVADSLEIHCAGTDRRLEALKRRYRSEPLLMHLLDEYETSIERTPTEP